MPLDLSALLAMRPRQVVLRANADMKTTNPTTPALASDQKALLLRSVASFLDANGFSKTLKRFLFEADIPIEDLKSSADLEEIYSKYLEICDDAKTKLKDKDKKAVTEEVKKPVQQLEEPDKNEDKNKKKKKKLSPESDPVPDATEKKSEDVNVEEKTSADIEPHKKKTKDKEKKKQAPVSVTHNVDSEANETQAEEKSSKSKTKKKKKDESKDTNVDSKISDAVAATEEDSKGSKKRKRAVPDENQSKPSDKIETEESKRRKVNGASEQHEQGLENGIENNSNQQPNGLENGKIDKSAEKSALQKSGKKETNGSAEPSTVKAFQRVKVDEVVFTDDRLKDNSYWAKGGADSGYGAKAEEVLGQVRGRGFRHEKTKKKRGSYRGGQIDLQSHSIKFNYSDEE